MEWMPAWRFLSDITNHHHPPGGALVHLRSPALRGEEA
jgi:hypothetical protein